MSKWGTLQDENNEEYFPCPYYPVGSIYISVNNTNPKTYFGGTWEQIQNRFLLACGSSYSNGSTGGSITHSHTQGSTGSTSLSVDQMPSHNHNLTGTYGSILTSATNNEGKLMSGALGNGWNNTKTNVSSEGKGKGHTHTNPSTNSSSNMPPYLAVYMWKRTA